MNILIIDNSVAFTGAFKCALNEADLLSGKHKVSFVLPSNSTLIKQVKRKGYKVHALPLKEISRSAKAVMIYPYFLISNLIVLRKIIKEDRIDVVQVNDFYNLLGALLKLTGYKGRVITWVRFLPESIPGTLRTLWIHSAQKYSNKVVAVSEAVLSQLPVQPNTVRLYDPINLQEAGKIYKGTEAGVTHFLYLANFTRGKGQEYAIEAFNRVYKINSNVRLKIAGGDMGLAKNAMFKEELRKLINRLALVRVVSVVDFIDDIASEIRAADIVLNFSDRESFSMTCLEASFYERPVIATMCGGPEEIIAHRETGILVPRKDIKAMSEAMLLLANDHTIRQAYGIRGKQYVTQKFSREVFAKALNEIIFDYGG